MTLQQFEYIIAIDEHKNFSKAAYQCRVTQPTLSAMVQKMEEELNVKLFDRTKQPIQTTLIGKQIVQRAKEILRQSNQIYDLVAEQKDCLVGSFKLGILPTIAPYLLPRFLTQFVKDFPQLELQIMEMTTAEILQALAKGKIEAGILAQLGETSSFAEHSLFYECFYAYVSEQEKIFKQQVIKTTDITGERLWLLDEGHCFRDQLVKFCSLKQVKEQQLAYHLGSIETFMRMVENGQGITFIPALAVDQLAENQKRFVRPFAIPSPTRHITLITQPFYLREKIVSQLVKYIQKSVPNHMLSLQKAQTLV